MNICQIINMNYVDLDKTLCDFIIEKLFENNKYKQENLLTLIMFIYIYNNKLLENRDTRTNITLIEIEKKISKFLMKLKN